MGRKVIEICGELYFEPPDGRKRRWTISRPTPPDTPRPEGRRPNRASAPRTGSPIDANSLVSLPRSTYLAPSNFACRARPRPTRPQDGVIFPRPTPRPGMMSGNLLDQSR